jgi:hypothetical protein
MRISMTDAIPQRLSGNRRMITNAEAAQIMRRSADVLSAATTDAAMRTTDPAPASRWLSWRGRGRFRDDNTLITPIGTPKNPGLFGRSPSPWDGYSKIKEQLDSMSVTDRANTLRRIADDYGNSPGTGLSPGSMRPGNAGSLTTGADDESFLGSGATPTDVMDANKKFWDDMAKNNVASRDSTPPRDATGLQIQAMQRANDAFWKAQTAHQRTPAKEWGKG